jgi:hypothetical protein
MNYRELLSIEGLPVFQNKMFRDRVAAINCPKGDVKLVQNMETGLLFNVSFDADLLVYDAEYQNEQACSVVFQKHLEEVKAIIQRHFSGKPLIEVGCGKGYFLEFLSQAGYDIVGIDPAYEGNNIRVIKAPFESRLGISGKGIVLRHVLEHISNPCAFLTKISDANGGKGRIYIEVPSFDWICERKAWFDIFYEHVNYFRLVDFYRMFGKVYECGHFFGGQYLYVVADLATLRQPVLNQEDTFNVPTNFWSSIDLFASMARGKRTAIWGGASKGVIFALYMQRAGVNIDAVIDINPYKQNKYIAGTGQKISSPGEAQKQLKAGDCIFVMNANYLQEIMVQSKNQFNYIKVEHHEL